MTAGPVPEPRRSGGRSDAAAPLRMLRARARQFLASGMAACLARANDNLFELANAGGSDAAQTRCLDALRRWHGARQDLVDGLLRDLDAAFAALGGAAPALPAADATGEGLALDDELDELIAVDAMIATATAGMGDVLERLLGRMAALCGATPEAGQFPLTPRFIVTSLRRALAPLGLAPPARRAILRACEATLLHALPDAVAEADRLLDQLGVTARGGAASAVVDAAPGADLRALLRDPAALAGEDRQRVRLVAALFAELAAAEWMSPALGALFTAAERPVLTLARAEPDFLTRPLHPARRLVQEIIVAATDFLSGDDYADRELFRQARAALAELAAAGTAPERLAALLIGFVSRVEEAREQAERSAVPALREAAARERAAAARARVARILDGRVNGRRYPLAFIDLLERGWCRVLFDAWLAHGEQSPQWRGAVHLLDQLAGVLGDAEPDPELVDRLLAALADRLDSSPLDRCAARGLLDGLYLCLHRDAAPPPAPPGLVLTPAEARELADARLPVVAGGLELALPGTPAPVVAEIAAELSEIDLGRVDALRPGGWVEFRDAAGGALRARFLGVVQPADAHLFADAEGAPVRQLPRLRLALMLRDGAAVPVDNTRLFDRALERARSTLAAESD